MKRIEDFKVLKITQYESTKIRERYPDVVIITLNRQSSHKKYFVEQTRKVVRYLDSIKKDFKVVEKYGE